MAKSRKKPNKLNQAVVENLKRQLERAFPYGSMKKAGFIKAPEPLGLSEDSKFKKQFVSAAIEIRNEDANVRVYRKPDPGDKHDYDVDEIRSANKRVVTQPAKSEISDHWLKGSIPNDLMGRNNLSVELVPDGVGGLKPNVQPDGTVMAFINFMDDLPLDESTPGEQTWFCRTCRKRFTVRYNPATDRMMLTHMFRQQHLSQSSGCRGEVEVLIRSKVKPAELEDILRYDPA